MLEDMCIYISEEIREKYRMIEADFLNILNGIYSKAGLSALNTSCGAEGQPPAASGGGGSLRGGAGGGEGVVNRSSGGGGTRDARRDTSEDGGLGRSGA